MQHVKDNKSLKRTENEKRNFNTPPLEVCYANWTNASGGILPLF